ncbi:hypothetical protein S83_019729, partial [Arachis hypogaea]
HNQRDRRLNETAVLGVPVKATIKENLFPIIFHPTCSSAGEERHAEIKWDEIGFGIVSTDFMYVMKCSKGEDFGDGSLIPYGNIELPPSAGILNYGQGTGSALRIAREIEGEKTQDLHLAELLGEPGTGGSSTPLMVGVVKKWQKSDPQKSLDTWRRLSEANSQLEIQLNFLSKLAKEQWDAYKSVIDSCSKLRSEK